MKTASQKEMERHRRRLAEGRPTPTEMKLLASPIVKTLPVRWGSPSRALKKIQEMYDIPRQDLDLWYCGTVDSV